MEISTLITAEDVTVVEIPVEAVPESSFTDPAQVIDKLTITDLAPGEIILGDRIVDPNVISNDGRVALVLSEEKVLMAYPATDLLSTLDVLKPGDHVDFLYTMQLPVDRETGFLPGAEERGSLVLGPGEAAEMEDVTFNLLQNVTISAVARNYDDEGQPVGPPRAFLLTVNPQDALVLKYMKDVGAIVDLVLRAPQAEGTFSVEPVDLDYVINGYIVPSQAAP
jgi:pilus assembly protein CpaB